MKTILAWHRRLSPSKKEHFSYLKFALSKLHWYDAKIIYFWQCMQQAPIGIFDSGIGGLTVAKTIHELLPQESLFYYGDTLHLPYGEKSEARIKEFCETIVQFLIEKGVKIIIIACNSASAVAASYLRKKYHSQVEIRGVIRPMLAASATHSYKKIGLIGTQATVNSGIYNKILNDYNSTAVLQSVPTPLLAPMIEEGMHHKQVSQEIIKEYLQKFTDIEALLLACTHYPLIKEAAAAYFDHQIDIYDNATFMAVDVKQYLSELNLLNCDQQKTQNTFLVSDYTQTFAKTASMFFGKEIKVTEHNIFANT